MRRPSLLGLVLALAVFATVPAAAAPAALDPSRAALYAQAFALAEAGRWPEARQMARAGRDPILDKVLTWLDLKRADGEATFIELDAFLRANPNWPHRNTLRIRAERALPDIMGPTALLDWFREFPPITQDAKLRQMAALKAVGRTDELARLARDSWRKTVYARTSEEAFLRDFGALLRPEDHATRTNWLLWEGHTDSASRMLGRLPADLRALANARIKLRELDKGVDGAINAVPAKYQNDPGLLFERIRWRRMKGRDDEARALLVQAPADPAHASYWWRERNYYFREALADGHISNAYDLARKHGARSGIVFADGEFLAGWTALRFLKDKQEALAHFKRMYEGVSTPISQGRAAYWAGRAAEALNRPKEAADWYGKAGEHVTTFYGQLSAARLQGGMPALPADPKPTAAERKAFAGRELVAVVQRLSAIQQSDQMQPFLEALMRDADTPGERLLAVEMARTLASLDTGVKLARQSALDGIHLMEAGYPVLGRPIPGEPELPLVLSLIRQESNFDQNAISRAGARGLMQLMPATAKSVAAKLDLPYALPKLTEQPDFNMRLGTTYLSGLLDDFQGFYPAAIAGYNAGPGRARRWLAEIGDPRRGEIDPIDWIELIPFSETRNYVQRVLENLYIYRTLLQAHPAGIRGDQALHVWCITACGVRIDTLQKDAQLLPRLPRAMLAEGEKDE